MIWTEFLPEESRWDTEVCQVDEPVIIDVWLVTVRLDGHGDVGGLLGWCLRNATLWDVIQINVDVTFGDLFDVVDDEHVQWLQVQVHDTLWVDLVQTEQQVSGDDLDVTKIESFTTVDEVLDQIGSSHR